MELPLFKLGEVAPAHVGLEGKFILRHAFGMPKAAEVGREKLS